MTAGPPPSYGAPRRAAEPVDTTTMGGAAGWTIAGTLIPGLGLWRAGHRVTGGLIMAFAAVIVGGLVGVLLVNKMALASAAVDPAVLYWATAALAVLALGWVVVIGATFLSLRPHRPTLGQRVAGAALVGVLSFLVAAPMAIAANFTYTTAGLVNAIFDPSDAQSATKPTITNQADPWADKARLNVLILGGDSGNDRAASLGDRTDTVILASIDTKTGASTLFSLPRNTARMPFPAESALHKYYPNGFYDGVNPANANYFLNAMYRTVPARVPHDALGQTKNFAADVMKLSVGEALGLDVDYYVKVNMDGFKDFINALGGITVNVNYRVPIGGQTDAHILPDSYIEPGPNQHLKGRLALWYARGRYGLDDYSRMERQRCVINAVVQQASPQNVLLNYQKVAQAGEKTIQTDIPRSMLPAMLTLADRVHGTTLRSVVFRAGDGGWVSANPNWAAVKTRVKKALKESAASAAKPSASATASATAKPSTSAKPSASPTTKAKSDDLDNECAYHPAE